MYTAPITKLNYLGGRFLAAFTLNTAILLALHAGILLSLLLPRPQPDFIGPWLPAGHLTAFFVIALPHGFIVTVFQFAAALRQRRALAAYIASVLLFVFALIVGTTIAQAFRQEVIAKLFDFIGPANVMIAMERWTPLERNTRVVALEGLFLVNRSSGLASHSVRWRSRTGGLRSAIPPPAHGGYHSGVDDRRTRLTYRIGASRTPLPCLLFRGRSASPPNVRRLRLPGRHSEPSRGAAPGSRSSASWRWARSSSRLSGSCSWK